jgi:SAM-dependent methyltransferase
MIDTKQLYAEYHQNCPFENFGASTFLGKQAMIAYPDAGETLDFGCGNGIAVRQMRLEDEPWFGLEYSETAFEKYLSSYPFFYVGDTSQFPDRRFDMTYSTEVLEHIPAELIPEVVQEICRITARYIFMTISLRPSSDNNRYHCTLRPREWWERHFASNGFVRDDEVVRRFQKVTLRSTKAILSKWAHLGPDCLAFAQNPPYELHGETQFWFFAFRRAGVPAPARNLGRQPFVRRTIIPALRKLLRMDQPVRSAA